jgi:glycosyltransferase involved in cell wall biosynthesis
MTRVPTVMMISNTARSFWLFRRHLIADLVARGCRVVCVAVPDDLVGQIKSLGAEFMPLPLSRSGMNPAAEIRSVWHLYRLLTTIRPAVVVTYTIKPNTYTPVLARLLKIPCLAVVTGLGYSFLDGSARAGLAARIMAFGVSFAPHIWILNNDDRLELQRRHVKWASRAQVIAGEGIDTSHFNAWPLPNNGFVTFLMNARLLKDKGVMEYAAAARIVRAKYPETRFLLIGGHDHGNPSAISDLEYTRIVKGGDITYLGTMADVRPHIAASDCNVLASYREGVPLVLLEGASMARPLIATDVPGCRDVVDNHQNGLLCRARDAGDLARAMFEFIALPYETRTQMGQAARDKILREFDVSIVLAAYHALLARYLKG